MIKIAIIIFAILSIVVIYRKLKVDYFTEKFEQILKNKTRRNLSEFSPEELVEIVNMFDINDIHYNYTYNWGLINNLAHIIKDKAIKNPELEQVIHKKIIDVYGLIKQDNEKSKNIKNYLKFMNLVGESGLPSFIEINRKTNMSDDKTNLISTDIILLNEIKILLILMSKNIINKIKYFF